MANRLQLKRGSGAPGTIFYEGEPIYDKSGKILYVGNDGGSGSGAGSAVASAGAYSAVTEILNQASSTASGFIKLLEDTDNGNHNVSLKAPAAIASNYSLVLPDGTGSAGQVLKTDGSGNLDWVDQTSGYSGFSITDGSNTQSVESAGTVTFTGGDGIDAVVSATDTLTISADLTSNGGLIIGPAPGATSIALDLGASNIYGTLAISDGGTGATTAAAARAGLGVSIGTDVQAFDQQLADIAGLTPSDGGFIVGDGSNFVVESAATARTSLGVDAAGTDNSTDVTLVTTSHDYLSISSQAITLNAINLADDVTGTLAIADGGTGATSALDARAGLGVSIGTDVQAYDAQLADIAGLTPSDGGFIVGDGSNFVVESAATARTSLGVDAAGTDNSTDVTLVTTSHDYLSISGQAITLGAIDLAADVTGDLPVTEGGTGASNASDARTNLGLVIGTDVQAYDAQLADVAGLTPSDGGFIVGDGSNFVVESAATARTSLGVDAAGTDNSTDVTLVTTSYDYLSISGQAITLGQITNDDLANSSITVSDGTNSSTRALGETLTIQGTANEVTVTESSGTVTVALPDDVTIGNDLTVNGNLNVVGTAVTFSAETTRIEDRILELGLVNGAAPSSATTWDLGVAFNYNSSGAKKAGVAWLNNGFMAMLSELAESSDTGNADPQITATAYAKIAGHSLYLGGIASSNEIIDNTGAAVNLVFDGGSY